MNSIASTPGARRPRANGAIVSFHGRLDRTGYVIRFGAGLLAEVLVWVLCWQFVTPQDRGWAGLLASVVLSIALGTVPLVLLLFWSIQRLHDMNLKGWWLLVLPVPAAWPFALVLFVWPGTAAANRFDAPTAAPAPSNVGAVATVATTALGAGALAAVAGAIGFVFLILWAIGHTMSR